MRLGEGNFRKVDFIKLRVCRSEAMLWRILGRDVNAFSPGGVNLTSSPPFVGQ